MLLRSRYHLNATSPGQGTPLKVGDRVSMAVRNFDESYTQERGGHNWASDSVAGTVTERADGKILVDFGAAEDPTWWSRHLVRFEWLTTL